MKLKKINNAISITACFIVLTSCSVATITASGPVYQKANPPAAKAIIYIPTSAYSWTYAYIFTMGRQQCDSNRKNICRV